MASRHDELDGATIEIMKKTKTLSSALRGLFCLGFALSGLIAQPAAATETIIYADDFSGAPGSLLNGTTLDTRSGTFGGSASATWSADSGFKADGSVFDGAPFVDEANLPFVPQAGSIYTLSAGMDTIVGGASYIGLGFGDAGTIRRNWILLRDARPGNRGQYQAIWLSNGSFFVPAGTVTLSVVLDTTETVWGLEYFADGVSVSGRIVFENNPPITKIGFAHRRGAAGTVANFSLTRRDPTGPEIAVQEVIGTDLTDDRDLVDLGTVAPGSSSAPKMITIKNIGDANLTGLAVTKDGAGTDPNNPDSDGDGLSDGEEINVLESNPLNADTDGDGISDGDEVANHTDPNLSVVTTDEIGALLDNLSANLIGGLAPTPANFRAGNENKALSQQNKLVHDVEKAAKEITKGHLDHARKNLAGKLADRAGEWLLEPARTSVLDEIDAIIARIDGALGME